MKNKPLVWILLLTVYLVLFGCSGYIAFFKSDGDPASNINGAVVSSISDQATKEAIISGFKSASELYKKRVELAFQAFNVILGALLGFLSASATWNAGVNNSKLEEVNEKIT